MTDEEPAFFNHLERTDLRDVVVQDIDGEPVVLGDRVARHLVLQVLRYYG